MKKQNKSVQHALKNKHLLKIASNMLAKWGSVGGKIGGKIGGKARTQKKIQAAKRNGKKGGRPKIKGNV